MSIEEQLPAYLSSEPESLVTHADLLAFARAVDAAIRPHTTTTSDVHAYRRAFRAELSEGGHVCSCVEQAEQHVAEVIRLIEVRRVRP